MTTLASLRILLGLESPQVKTGAANVKGELKGVQAEANRTNAILRDIGKGVGAGLGIGAGLGAFQLASKGVREFTDLIGDSVRASIEEQAGIDQLGQSLKANVADYKGNTDAIEANIKVREDLGFADDEQRASISKLVAATKDVNSALAIEATAMDLARFKNISLGEATDALTKVEAGSFRILKSLGIELRDGATQTEALAAVQKVAAGQAKVFGETTAGAMAAANVAVNDLQEDIGIFLAPAVRDAAKAIKDDLIPAVREIGGVIGTVGEIAGPFIELLKIMGHVPPSDLGKITKDALASEVAARAATAAYAAYNLALTDLRVAFTEGKISEQQYREQGDILSETFVRLAANTSDFASVAQDLAPRVTAAAGAISLADDNTAGWAARAATAAPKVDDLAAPTDALRIAQEKLKAAADLQSYSALNASDAWKAYAGSLSGVQFTADQLIADLIKLNGMHVEVSIDLNMGGVEAVADATGVFAGIVAQNTRDAQDAADKIARAYHDKVGKAYDDVADRAHEAFARIHQDVLDQIDDARAAANAQLDEQERAIRGTVDAARAQVQAMRDARHLQDLRGAVAGAATPEDLAAANRALNDFLTDQRLAALGSQADTQIAALKLQEQANNDKAALATAAENQRNADQVKALDADLANLKEHLGKYTKEWDKAFAEIARAAKRYGVADIVGVHPISLATGSKATSAIPSAINPAVAGVGTAAPAVTVVNKFYLDGADITDLISIRQASSAARVTSGGIAG